MKKIILSCFLIIGFISCSMYRSLDPAQLTIGMSKADVEAMLGLPDRLLGRNQTADGLQETLEYRTYNNEVYALEFWDDYLTGYEFLYDDVDYVPAVVPPAIRPPHGKPILQVPNRPNKPNKPNKPNRPNIAKPDSDRSNLTKPAEGVGPANNTNKETDRSKLAR